MIPQLLTAGWFAPLITFLLLALPVGRWSRQTSGWIAVAGPALSFLSALGILIESLMQGSLSNPVHVHLWTWIPDPDIPISFAFHLDPLALTMMLVVTGVGTLIHIYSIGYMSHDEGFRRYFAYLNLFIVMMLTLVLADALPMLFIGWEGVGLCSYLLIGFWFERPRAARAGRKAFIVNRIGDAGFLIGIFLIARLAGTWTWEGLSQWASNSSLSTDMLGLALLALFIGATGKSAQIPLYVWLPDAMEGPTPVSALIHAATMVTAGVYMVVRLHSLYELVPAVGLIIAIVGLATAFYAGLVALAQTEMKKILAFSTVSQLGYMFIAAGVGAYVAAIFHLVTHAFFKALLFLLTGNVMHATGDEQDIYRLGNLREKMPVTYRLFAIGALTLAGLPPLSAFFSKEAILNGAYQAGPVLWFFAWLAAGVTALYSLRLFLVPFFHDRENPQEPHEAPSIMIWPLYVLAFFSIFGGALGPFLNRALEDFGAGVHGEHGSFLLLSSLVILLVGVTAGWIMYRSGDSLWQARLNRWEPVRRLFERQLGWNEFYDRLVVRPVHFLAEKVVFAFFDTVLIDGIVDGSARIIGWMGNRLRPVHSGEIRRYAFAILVGAVLLLLYFVAIHQRWW